MNQLVTGDAVLLDLRPARIPSRMLATGIDLALMFGATYLSGYIVRRVGGSDARVEAVTIVGALLINLWLPDRYGDADPGAYGRGVRARAAGGPRRRRIDPLPPGPLMRGLAFWAVGFAIWTGFCGGLI